MKASLEFNLPDEEELFTMATNGHRAHFVLIDLDQYLRSRIKYAPDDELDAVIEAFQHIRTKLNDLCYTNSINIQQ
jgi:hypothetical protein